VATASAWLAGAALSLGIPTAWAATPWGPGYFPNVTLTAHDGRTVRFYDDLLKGKAVAINAIYTTCRDECPVETARLVQVQRRLGDRVGKDIFFYSISIDPRRDTPEVLRAYAEKFGVGPGWLFLTGKAEDVRLVTSKLGLSRGSAAGNTGDSARGASHHRPILMVGHEPTGQWMRNSAVDNPAFLATTIKNFLTGWDGRTPGRTYAEVAKIAMPDKGEYLFRLRCGSCHTIGQGDKVGPDLLGVTSRREHGWLVRYLKAPDEVLAESDPIATALFAKYKNVPMPNLRLGDDEVSMLLSYLDARARVAPEQHRHGSPSQR
jgi:protein SCO1/2